MHLLTTRSKKDYFACLEKKAHETDQNAFWRAKNANNGSLPSLKKLKKHCSTYIIYIESDRNKNNGKKKYAA